MTSLNAYEGCFLSRKKVRNSFRRHFSTWIPRYFSIDIENVKLTVSALTESSRNVINKVKSSTVHVFDLEIAHIVSIDDPTVDYSDHNNTNNSVSSVESVSSVVSSTNPSECIKPTHTHERSPDMNTNINKSINASSKSLPNNNHSQTKNILSISDPQDQVEIWIQFENQSLLTSWEHTLKIISTERIKQRHDQHIRILARMCDFIRFKRDQVLRELVLNSESLFFVSSFGGKVSSDGREVIDSPIAASVYKANDYESIVLTAITATESDIQPHTSLMETHFSHQIYLSQPQQLKNDVKSDAQNSQLPTQQRDSTLIVNNLNTNWSSRFADLMNNSKSMLCPTTTTSLSSKQMIKQLSVSDHKNMSVVSSDDDRLYEVIGEENDFAIVDFVSNKIGSSSNSCSDKSVDNTSSISMLKVPDHNSDVDTISPINTKANNTDQADFNTAVLITDTSLISDNDGNRSIVGQLNKMDTTAISTTTTNLLPLSSESSTSSSSSSIVPHSATSITDETNLSMLSLPTKISLPISIQLPLTKQSKAAIIINNQQNKSGIYSITKRLDIHSPPLRSNSYSTNNTSISTVTKPSTTINTTTASTTVGPATATNNNSNCNGLLRSLYTIPAPRLHIVILAVGTWGDVQPFISIGKQLQSSQSSSKSHDINVSNNNSTATAGYNVTDSNNVDSSNNSSTNNNNNNNNKHDNLYGSSNSGGGHRVRLVTHACYRELVEATGLEFYPLAGNPQKLSEFMVKSQGCIIPLTSDTLREAPQHLAMISDIIHSCWDACVAPYDLNSNANVSNNTSDTSIGSGACTKDGVNAHDITSNVNHVNNNGNDMDHIAKIITKPFRANAIISNPVTYGHIHCAEALNVPLHLMFPQPWLSTKAFPHPLSCLSYRTKSWSIDNKLSYQVVDALIWMSLHTAINSFRTQRLSLPPLAQHLTAPLLSLSDRKDQPKIPFVKMWSPNFVPKPRDWPYYVDVVGTFVTTASNDKCHLDLSNLDTLHHSFGGGTSRNGDDNSCISADVVVDETESMISTADERLNNNDVACENDKTASAINHDAPTPSVTTSSTINTSTDSMLHHKLLSFLQNGNKNIKPLHSTVSAPLFIGFGSMVMSNVDKIRILSILIEACAVNNLRVIFQSGWTTVTQETFKDICTEASKNAKILKMSYSGRGIVSSGAEGYGSGHSSGIFSTTTSSKQLHIQTTTVVEEYNNLTQNIIVTSDAETIVDTNSNIPTTDECCLQPLIHKQVEFAATVDDYSSTFPLINVNYSGSANNTTDVDVPVVEGVHHGKENSPPITMNDDCSTEEWSAENDVIMIGACDHNWLFQHVSGVIHHGGAGTTSAGLVAACPTWIIPFFGDQFFWGEMVRRKSLGPAPCPLSQLTLTRAIESIAFLLSPQTILASKTLSELMRKEDGAKGATEAFYKHLPLHRMLCDVSLFLNSSCLAEVICEECGGLKMTREIFTIVHSSSASLYGHVCKEYSEYGNFGNSAKTATAVTQQRANSRLTSSVEKSTEIISKHSQQKQKKKMYIQNQIHSNIIQTIQLAVKIRDNFKQSLVNSLSNAVDSSQIYSTTGGVIANIANSVMKTNSTQAYSRIKQDHDEIALDGIFYDNNDNNNDNGYNDDYDYETNTTQNDSIGEYNECDESCFNLDDDTADCEDSFVSEQGSDDKIDDNSTLTIQINDHDIITSNTNNANIVTKTNENLEHVLNTIRQELRQQEVIVQQQLCESTQSQTAQDFQLLPTKRFSCITISDNVNNSMVTIDGANNELSFGIISSNDHILSSQHHLRVNDEQIGDGSQQTCAATTTANDTNNSLPADTVSINANSNDNNTNNNCIHIYIDQQSIPITRNIETIDENTALDMAITDENLTPSEIMIAYQEAYICRQLYLSLINENNDKMSTTSKDNGKYVRHVDNQNRTILTINGLVREFQHYRNHYCSSILTAHNISDDEINNNDGGNSIDAQSVANSFKIILKGNSSSSRIATDATNSDDDICDFLTFMLLYKYSMEGQK